MPIAGNVHVFESVEKLYLALQELWLLRAQAAIKDHGAFHVALSGGSTPRKLYERLAKQSSLSKELWEGTHIYFGDERCVPQDHPDSNYRMARETLLAATPLLPEKVHAMFLADISVEENVQRYNKLLCATLPLNEDGFPVFDLVLLGMGEDGHTASLFPGTEILHESARPVAAQFVKKLDAWRISFTFPAINAACHVAVMVVGKRKSEIIPDILSASKSNVAHYPIVEVNPTGQLDWYLDAAAAQLLKGQK